MSDGSADWDLKSGDTILRVHLHQKYGGSGQGGINPSRRTPNILIFSDPKTGHQHGYHDHWDGGLYLYVGEGQSGDQQMTRGNRQILEHQNSGRSIRLFRGSRGTVQYVGEFEVADREPWFLQDARQKDGGLRKVIVFRLKFLS